MGKETLTSWLMRKIRKDDPPPVDILPQEINDDLLFAMESNGYSLGQEGGWKFNSGSGFWKTSNQSVYHQRIFGLFFPRIFSNYLPESGIEMAKALGQKPVSDVIRKYRKLDKVEARRISFLLGGIAYHFLSKREFYSEVLRPLEFTTKMTSLGERKSGEAIASAMAMYLVAGGSFEEDSHFERNIYYMAEAITEERINPQVTEDLGISQAFRLRNFLEKIQITQDQKDLHSIDIAQYREAFSEFPTIGAEFHIPDSTKVYANFWQRLAILNMSQYQRESPIPFSGNDQGVIEIRMNPSIYPFTIATWNLMRLLVPELNQSYFTLTLNRQDANFSSKKDAKLVTLLHSLGNLGYAAFFQEVPPVEDPEGLRFGGRYIGQTVRVKNGEYSLIGHYSAAEGQLNVYTGFGDLFPYLAYYSSMALAEPTLLRYVEERAGAVTIPTQAIKMEESNIQYIFEAMNNSILEDSRLRKAAEYGQRIIDHLSP